MAAKSLSGPAVLRAAQGLGIIPADAEVSRQAEVRWVAGELEYVAWVVKEHTGALSWYLNVEDAKFGPLLDEYGRMAVRVRSDSNEMPWPRAVDGVLESFLLNGLGRAVRFVADRTDLCLLLADPKNVYRGDMYAWQFVPGYPARLVQALVLARDIGNPELEAMVLEKLGEESVRLPDGSSMDIMATAKSWVPRYAKELGMDIPIPWQELRQ